MNKQEKSREIQDFSELYQNCQLFVVTENGGLNAAKTVELRRKVYKTGGKLRVFKNTMVAKGLDGEKNATLIKNLKGPNTFMFGGENFVEDLKVLMEFAKENKNLFSIKCGSLDGSFVSSEDLIALSKLPGKDQMRAQVLATMLAPVTGFVNALAGNIRNLVNVLNNVKSAKEEGAQPA